MRYLLMVVGLMSLGTTLIGGCSQSTAPPVLGSEVVVVPPAIVPVASNSEAAPTTETKLAILREAVATKQAASAVQYLRDPDPVVRRGAILAVGPETSVDPEVLFASLHDVDPEVQALTVSALRARGLNLNQVSLARQFSDSDPAERLAFLNDLAGGAVNNPGSWLARLSEDPEPAVRLGAVRVATEMGLKTTWIERIARDDPDIMVRRGAGHYHNQTGEITQTGHGR